MTGRRRPIGVVACVGALICALVGLLVPLSGAAATTTDTWVFVSSPDYPHTDSGDLSGSTPGVPAAPGWALEVSGGVNGISPQMLAIHGQIAAE
jgi:hypothetical protein